MRQSTDPESGIFINHASEFLDYYLGTGLLSVVGPNFASIAAVRYDDTL